MLEGVVLLEVRGAGRGISSTLSPPGASLTHHLPLNLAVVRTLVDAVASLSVAYGSADEQVIAEDTLNGHQLQVSLRQDVWGWTLIVRGTPPLNAIVSFHRICRGEHRSASADWWCSR